MKKAILALIMTLLWAPSVHSQQIGFANNADEILNMLTEDKGRAFLQIEFEVNSARIDRKKLILLDALGEALTSGEGKHMQITLVGHTDSSGADEYNRKLSLDRAISVKNYLVETYNLSPSRITAQGMGEKSPIAPNNTSQGRALNRRVEVINTSSKSPEIKGPADVGNSLFQ